MAHRTQETCILTGVISLLWRILKDTNQQSDEEIHRVNKEACLLVQFMAAHSSILAGIIPRTKEHDRRQSMGLFSHVGLNVRTRWWLEVFKFPNLEAFPTLPLGFYGAFIAYAVKLLVFSDWFNLQLLLFPQRWRRGLKVPTLQSHGWVPW